ncbi:hypothetical protein SXCC_02369 [Gluconacetobacter sp. SXCC-1]|nr:hypothetical protein SXCC_02369 [Gluconacetobacter sp. SXCC-1]
MLHMETISPAGNIGNFFPAKPGSKTRHAWKATRQKRRRCVILFTYF